MRQIIYFLLLIGWATGYAQVKEHDTFKPKLSGEKYLKGLDKEVILSSYTIYFRTSDWAATGTAVSGLGAAAYLDLPDEVGKSITAKSRAYLENKLKEAGISVNLITEDQVNTQYAKQIKKGQATVTKGGSYSHIPKKASDGNSYKAFMAEGIVMARGDKPGNLTYHTTSWTMMGGKIDLIFEPTLYFVVQKAGGNSDTHTTSTKAQLAISAGELGNGAGVRFFSPKFKSGTLNMAPHSYSYEDENWLKAMDEQEELYGNSYNFSINPEAYEAACLELLKAYIDKVVVAMTENLWNS